MDELSHELPNDVRLKILVNEKNFKAVYLSFY